MAQKPDENDRSSITRDEGSRRRRALVQSIETGQCSGTRPPPGAVSPSRKRDQEAARSNRSECPSYRSKKKGCAPRRRRLGRHLGGALRQRGLGRRLGGALRQRHLGWCHLCAARVSVPPPGAALSVGVAPRWHRLGRCLCGALRQRCFFCLLASCGGLFYHISPSFVLAKILRLREATYCLLAQL